MIETLVAAGALDPLTAHKAIIDINVSQRKALKCTEQNMPYHAVVTPGESPAQTTCRDRDATKELLALLKDQPIPHI
jgi:hypothetical protein